MKMKLVHTSKANFDKFDKSYIDTGAGASVAYGFYFSQEPIEEYGSPIECEVTIDNPLYVDAANEESIKEYAKICKVDPEEAIYWVNQYKSIKGISKAFDECGLSTEIATQNIKDAGYDGVIVENTTAGIKDKRPLSKEYIVFKPEQIEILSGREKTRKQRQLDIINKYNPMHDDYHTGIRTVDDIKTFEEVQYDSEFIEDGVFLAGAYGDFSLEDYKKALKEKTITVYSSHDICPGTFVSSSFNMARDYAGNPNRVKSATVNIDDVAWINVDEGQYIGPITEKGEITIEEDNSLIIPSLIVKKDGKPAYSVNEFSDVLHGILFCQDKQHPLVSIDELDEVASKIDKYLEEQEISNNYER